MQLALSYRPFLKSGHQFHYGFNVHCVSVLWVCFCPVPLCQSDTVSVLGLNKQAFGPCHCVFVLSLCVSLTLFQSRSMYSVLVTVSLSCLCVSVCHCVSVLATVSLSYLSLCQSVVFQSLSCLSMSICHCVSVLPCLCPVSVCASLSLCSNHCVLITVF